MFGSYPLENTYWNVIIPRQQRGAVHAIEQTQQLHPDHSAACRRRTPSISNSENRGSSASLGSKPFVEILNLNGPQKMSCSLAGHRRTRRHI